MAGPGPVESSVLAQEGMVGMEYAAPSLTALPEDDRQKARLVWDLYQKAKRHKLSLGWAESEEHWDYWEGKHWKRYRPSSLSMVVANEMYSSTETLLGHIKDSIPSRLLFSRIPEHQGIAKMVSRLVDWSDDQNRLKARVELPGRSAIVTGFGAWRIDWDPTADGWRGRPAYNFVDENFLFVAPWARNIQEADYVIEARNVPVGYVRRTWERGKIVPAGIWDGTLTPLHTGAMTEPGLGTYAAFTTTDGLSTQVSREAGTTGKQRDLVTLIEAWIRQEDGDIRYLVVSNGVVLQDSASPYDDGKFPYAVFNVIKSKDSVYGRSLIKFVKSLQKELNEIHSYALDQQRYESDSPIIVDIENLEEGRSITNGPGQIYPNSSNRGQGYYVLQKPGANRAWFEMEELVKGAIREIGGNQDILRGDRPPGVSTLGGMEIVRDQANVLVAKMSDNLMEGLLEKDILVISRIKQFMKDHRVVRITGNGREEIYVSVNEPSEVGLDGSVKTKNSIPEDFEADVDFSPEPPGGYQARLERALALYTNQIVDAQYVLEEIDEDKSRIEELEGRRQQAAQAVQTQASAEGALKAGAAAPGVPPETPLSADEMTERALQVIQGIS